MRNNPKELECLYYFPERGDSAPICVECIVIWSWRKFPCALEMWNTAETREPQVDSDEALERQSTVLNGGSFSPVFILSSQPYSLAVLSYSWRTALPTLLFKDM